MCGIAGIVTGRNGPAAHRLETVERMSSALLHRGPDGGDIWMDRDAGIALAHRRLSIVDLSDAGRQPMHSHSEGLVITYNGEIYNFEDLRPDLEVKGHKFAGHSDTEVMLAAFESYGIERALPKFAGMFAFALWDRRTRIMHLVRDRMGKKPFYVAVINGAMVFASELKALLVYPGFERKIDARARALVLRNGWVPDDCCIWEGVFKLPPGTMLSVDADFIHKETSASLKAKVKTWWSLADAAEAGQNNLVTARGTELEDELDTLLQKVVRERMVADVPLGAFLSGGIDSSMVVGLMQAQSPRPIRTFTIGFREASFDESSHASDAAKHFGTDHTSFAVTPDDALSVIPQLPRIWDEPFADESQIPTYLLARLARQHVTVALSGDGGDECFGGYTRHVMPAKLERVFQLPLPVRKAGASAIQMLSPGSWEKVLGVVPGRGGSSSILNGENLHRFAGVLDVADDRELYERLIAVTPFDVLSHGKSVGVRNAAPNLSDSVSRLIYRDMAGYLPGDILVKLDRATMAVSLEGRCPFLDHRLVEFSWRLPTSVKIRDGKGKWLLRRVLSRYLPEAMFERPKQGFNLPIGDWLRGPLRDWAENLLDARRIRDDGFLDGAGVARCWTEHVSGRRDRSRELWAILMVQAWQDEMKIAEPKTVSSRLEAAQ
jgi:asparagine synthase (glutamine-hydrolysing)